MSADGRFVAFWSYASNLVAGDTNRHYDVFVRDGVAGTTERVDVSSGGAQANLGCDPEQCDSATAISADGRFVAFDSVASNLVAGDTNKTDDVFVRDRVAGTTERVSVSDGGAQVKGGSYVGAISADGRFVAFSSRAGDTGTEDVFVRDRVKGTTERVSVSDTGAQANGRSYGDDWGSLGMSADGRFVAFWSEASNLVAGDTNECTDMDTGKRYNCPDVFVRDRVAGTTERVDVSSTGAQADDGCETEFDFCSVAISGDGRFVAFNSEARNLAPLPYGDNGERDVFVRDRVKGTTERVSVSSAGAEADYGVGDYVEISADGRFVTFDSEASNLVAGDTNNTRNVFVRDRMKGTTEPVDVSNTGAQATGCNYCDAALAPISADGRYVAFTAEATNLVPGEPTIVLDGNRYGGQSDVFVRDRKMGTTTLVSVARK
jgi:hypothetical protein